MKNKIKQLSLRSPSRVPYRTELLQRAPKGRLTRTPTRNPAPKIQRCPGPTSPGVCVECLVGEQNEPTLFKVTNPSSVPYRTPSACAKMAAYPDPPPVILLPESIAAQPAYQLRYENTRTLSIIPVSAPARNVSRYWGRAHD